MDSQDPRWVASPTVDPRPLWKRAGFVLSATVILMSFAGWMMDKMDGQSFMWVAVAVISGQQTVNYRTRATPPRFSSSPPDGDYYS